MSGSGAPLRGTFNVQRSTSTFNGEGLTLRDIPILKCWPKDGGRFITLPNVHTRDPETGARNLGMYRMQIYDEEHDGNALADPQGRRAAWETLLRTR